MVHSVNILSCWESFKGKDTKRYILALFETVFLKFELLRKLWKQGERHSAFWCRLKRRLKVGTAEKMLKSCTIDDAFWRYLKRRFGSWNCWENFEAMDDRCCALTLFETMFLEFKLLRKRWKQREQMVLEFETAEKILKARTRNGVFWRSLKRCFVSWNCWEKIESKEDNAACILTLFEEYGRNF